jgi:hypothetical protein
MCLDAVDGTLTAADQVVFDRHVAGCVDCAEQYAEAKRGAAWMEILKEQRPEPPAGMLQRILAHTSEAEMSLVFPRVGVPTPAFKVVPQIGFQERMLDKFAATFKIDLRNPTFQPRMAMTAAMAFFSLALTMNLGGVQLSDLRPGAIQRTVADVKASAARSFQNMKVVYQVESRVNELRQGDTKDDDRDLGGAFSGGSSSGAPKQQAPVAKPAPQDQKQKQEQKPAPPNGTSGLKLPGSGNENQTASDADASSMQRGA